MTAIDLLEATITELSPLIREGKLSPARCARAVRR